MKPVYVTQVGAGISPWKMINFDERVAQVGIGVTVTGDVTYTVEYTYEDLNAMPAGVIDPTVFPHPTLQNLKVTADGAIVTPVAYIRINQTEGAGSTRMTFIQSGLGGL